MSYRKRTSTKKIEDYIFENKFISNEQLEYFLLNDFSEAEIMRVGLNHGRRSMRHGLLNIIRRIFRDNCFFRSLKVKKTDKGYYIED